MNIIEQFLLGKHKEQSKCEDIIFINNDFAAIIDGATTQSAYTFDGMSTGKKAALLVEEALESLDPESTKEQAANHITHHIHNFYKKEQYLSKILDDPKNKCTASVIIYSKYQSQIWLFGDCQCIVDGKHYSSEKLIDYISGNSRSIFIGSLLKKGMDIKDLLENDISRDSISHILNNQQSYQNIPLKDSVYGYVCFDGFDIPTEDVKTIIIPATARKIVLASDGYPKLFKTLSQSELYLEELKEIDPLCYKEYVSTKGFNNDLHSFDDRAYLSFKLKK